MASLLAMADYPAQSGGFSVDLERSRAAVNELRAVQYRLRALREDAVAVARTPATAHDLVSTDAFAMFAERADGGPGSLTAALDAGIVHVQRLIDQMSADLTAYQEADNAAARGFASS